VSPRSESRSVLIADDSAFFRTVAADALRESGQFRVAGVARDGVQAIRLVHDLAPDLVVMDLAMPGLDGLEAIGYIMSEAPRPIVVLSAHAGPGSDNAMRALELGAIDVVAKDGGDVGEQGRRLVEALRAASGAQVGHAPVLARPRRAPRLPWAPALAAHECPIVAIAASTGGPRALAEVIPALPADLDAAVLVVQHLPANFTRSLAQRLGQLSALRVVEAEEGLPVVPGTVIVARGDRHMVVAPEEGRLVVRLDDGPTMWGVRPAADRLFATLAEHAAARTLAVVLTGIGRDGARGVSAIVAAGGEAIAQDAATAVVDGMPGASRATGCVGPGVALGAMADAIGARLAAQGVLPRR
jgi:two-component system chemotaxis response regulator CheB